jgi:ligand-binding SRPBCC domain-containing protein
MSRHSLTQEQWVSASRSVVSDYFERPENLEQLTPSFLSFRIRTPPPIEMAVGAHIEYTIALYGVPMRWLTRIDEYVPGERFVDVQLSGPYRYWHHLHTFEDASGGTLLRDRVEFELPLGSAGDLAFRLFVRRNLHAIFSYRAAHIARLFGSEGPPPEPKIA